MKQNGLHNPAGGEEDAGTEPSHAGEDSQQGGKGSPVNRGGDCNLVWPGAAGATPLPQVDQAWQSQSVTRAPVSTLAFSFQDTSDDMTACEAKVRTHGAYKTANG